MFSSTETTKKYANKRKSNESCVRRRQKIFVQILAAALSLFRIPVRALVVILLFYSKPLMMIIVYGERERENVFISTTAENCFIFSSHTHNARRTLTYLSRLRNEKSLQCAHHLSLAHSAPLALAVHYTELCAGCVWWNGCVVEVMSAQTNGKIATEYGHTHTHMLRSNWWTATSGITEY